MNVMMDMILGRKTLYIHRHRLDSCRSEEASPARPNCLQNDSGPYSRNSFQMVQSVLQHGAQSENTINYCKLEYMIGQ